MGSDHEGYVDLLISEAMRDGPYGELAYSRVRVVSER
jgi:hypothetical protein